MGDDSNEGGLLASSDLAVSHAGHPAFRIESGRPSCHQPTPSYRQCAPFVHTPSPNDRGPVAQCPGGGLLPISLGIIRRAQGDGEKALQCFSKALEIDSELFEAHNNLGTLLLGQGQIEEAIRHFSHSLLLHPDQARVYNNLGAAMDLQGRSEEAIAHYHRALELAPSSYLIHNNLGKMFMEKGDLERAAEHFSKVIEIEPNFGDAHLNLGVVRKLLLENP